MGADLPTGLPAEGSDTVDATRAEGYATEDLYDLINSLRHNPESDVRDGVYDGDTLGRVGHSETDGGGVPETDRAGRGSSRDTGEPDGTDAVVDSDTGLDA